MPPEPAIVDRAKDAAQDEPGRLSSPLSGSAKTGVRPADWSEQVAAVKARVNVEGVSGSLGASLGTLFGINFKTTRTASDYIADYREAHREGDDAWPVW